MAEPKRIQLDAPKTLHREKKTKALPPTYRFDLKLNETKNSDCAEYSYAELVKEARSVENDSKHPGSDDPFSLDDDDQKLQEIARRYEEKYNPKPGRKKKKKLTVSEDYIDKGIGYDETDPFIDNDEAYDELVPSTLTTQFGGFYINKGDLEFRNMEDGGYDSKLKKKRFKGIDKDGRKKRRLGTEENQKRRGRKPLHDSTSALIKPVKKTQPTVADMLQQQKAKLQLLQQEGLQQMQLNPISVEREIEPEEEEENHVAEVPAQVTQVIGQGSTISEAIESVIKAATEDASNESVGPITGSSDNEEIKLPVDNVEVPKLPDNLPTELDDVVAKLKEVALRSEEGKCKFFSDDVNRMLLSIELKAQELTSAQRSNIYSHLASHLPCTKETLQKRAKKLRLDQEDGKLKEPMQRLRDGIAAVMPEMLEKYSARLKACDAKEEEKKNENEIGGSEGEDSQEGEKKTSRLPKKHFEWNDTIRKYLCDVVRIKLKCYEVSKTRIQSAEEYLKHFLEAEVKNLWPSGWMQSRILFRESRPAHFYITNRPKKQILVQKKNSPLQTLALGTKPAVSIVNNSVTQESEFDQIFHDKSVPLIPPVENYLERRENLDLIASNNGISVEERAAEYAKLFTLPIQSSVPDDLSVSKNIDTTVTNTTKATIDPPSTSSPLLNPKVNSVAVSKPHTKGDKQARLIQQNKPSPFPPKVTDYAAFAEGGSLASDMLARIICASLADYPYSGSHNIESASKTSSVISPNPSLIKDVHTLNSKFPNELHASPKKLEGGKSCIDKKKASQEKVSLMSDIGMNSSIESLLNSQNFARQKDPGIIVKNKGLPSENSIAVNLKLKDSIVPHPRQFAEAFERTADVSVVPKKHNLKAHNVHQQNSPISSSSSSRHLNSSDHVSDYPSSTSPRASLESAHKYALELANKFNTTTQGTTVAPYKKRTKYASSSKINDHWTQLFDASVGTSLLEGMKGFPFPVSLPTSLPTPPPAHSSSPHRTVAHSQHNSPRTNSHISPGLRSIHESKSESSNHNSQTHPNIISVSDVQRRQSLN